jgi:hypothetical protein
MIPPLLAQDPLVARCEAALNECRQLHEELQANRREIAYTLMFGAVVPPSWDRRRATHKTDAESAGAAYR